MTKWIAHCAACGASYSCVMQRCPNCGSYERSGHTPADEAPVAFLKNQGRR